MTALERMARAMAVADGEDPDMFTWGISLNKAGPPVWTHYTKFARAALLAIREPDEVMNKAGEDATDCFSCHPEPSWTAMIDAILSEKAE